MINIFQEIIKMLNEKILKAINDAPEKKNSQMIFPRKLK